MRLPVPVQPVERVGRLCSLNQLTHLGCRLRRKKGTYLAGRSRLHTRVVRPKVVVNLFIIYGDSSRATVIEPLLSACYQAALVEEAPAWTLDQIAGLAFGVRKAICS